MELLRHAGGEAPGYDGAFTGEVRLGMLQTAASEERPDVARVEFLDGAVTFWHRHPGGQSLLLLEGRGEVGTEAERHVLGPGDFVVATAEERHWHGAIPGGSCVFLALTWGATAWEAKPPR